MSHPLLKRIDPIRESGAWGSDPFGSGSTTWGGSDDEPYELSVIQLGSDDLTDDLNRDFAGVTQFRYGVPVATRTWMNPRSWRLNINVATKEYIEGLRQFFTDRVFYLQPDPNDDNTLYRVYWLEDQFRPQRVLRPGYYSLTATFVETPEA